MSKKEHLVWRSDSVAGQKNAFQIEEHNARRACEEWADWDDAYQDTFEIANGRNVTVCVIEEGSTRPPVEYIVTGEMERTYMARPMRERDAENDLHGGDAI